MQTLNDHPNWLLRGLYFLSKDLFDDDFKEVSEPDAAHLAQLRNQLEHRFLSFRDYGTEQSTDTHQFITIDDFENKALRLLKKWPVRRWSICLSPCTEKKNYERTQYLTIRHWSSLLFLDP